MLPLPWMVSMIAILMTVPAGEPNLGVNADETIIITGERVRRSVRNTDASVEVFDLSRLEREPGAVRLDDLYEATPNLLLGNPSQGPTIRGQDTTGPLIDLAAFLGGTRSRMTLNIDGRAASYNEFIFGVTPLWDVAQVEIFRSPQSITEGRNSIAGATYVRTRSPTFDWSGAGRLLLDDRGGRQLSLMVGGPVVADRLAFRLAADGRLGRPRSELADIQLGADPDHDDYGLVRAKLLATPPSLRGARFELTVQHMRSQAPQTETARIPFDQRRDLVSNFGIFGNRVTSATLRADVPVRATLTSQTIVSGGQSRIRRYASLGRGEAVVAVADRSIESRIEWAASPAVKVRGGFHGLRTVLDQRIDLTAILGIGRFDDRQTSLGIFGEVEWKPFSTASLAASLRSQRDRQHRTGGITGTSTIPFVYDRRFAFWLPRVALRWDATPTLRLGASVQRASNPGSASVNFITGELETLEAESLWNAEAFARATLLGGRLQLSANLFRNDHRNAQRALPRLFVGGTSSLTWYELYNLSRARTAGLEASLDWRLTSRLTLRGGVGLLRTKILDAGDGDPAFSGKAFARAPKRSATLSVDWQPLGGLSLSARLRHHSGYFSDDLNNPLRKVDAGTEADLRVAYRRGPYIWSAYARNATDEFAVTYLLSPVAAVPNRPREIGLSLEARF